ncbi:DUF6350 family protein [Citricoccus sp. K5]|uniref:cell division protein PerM n=1 Tax=Citricoccus sp. K5 TaxID=2653135 RepID=UPI00135C63BB|nr:DUF6350 family protein [Citricoccus sp. K5]
MNARTSRALKPLPLPLWIQGAIEALIAAVISAMLVLIPLVVIWSGGGFAATGIDFIAGLGGQAWLAIHGVPLHLSLESGTASDSLLTGTFWFLPWGLVLLPFFLGWRAGRRLARASYRDQIWQALAGGAVAYAAVGLGTSLLVPNAAVAINPAWGTLIPTAVMVLALLAGARREAGSWARLIGVDLADRIERLSQHSRWAGSYVWSVVRAGAVGLIASFGLAAALMAVQIGLHWADIAQVYQELNAGIWGGAVVTVAQLGIMPNLAMWTLAWTTGAGFSLGTGSVVAPLQTLVGPQPAVPVLTALPVGLEPVWSWLFLLLPVAGGFLAGWWLLREGENHFDEWLSLKISRRWASLTLSTLALGVFVALATAALAILPFWLSTGSLGVGRLTGLGPTAWLASVMLGGLVGLGAMFGYLVSPAWEKYQYVVPEGWADEDDEGDGDGGDNEDDEDGEESNVGGDSGRR